MYAAPPFHKLKMLLHLWTALTHAGSYNHKNWSDRQCVQVGVIEIHVLLIPTLMMEFISAHFKGVIGFILV